MGMPSINIVFRTTASTIVRRSQYGIVGAILKDATLGTNGAHALEDETEIPATLSEVNQDYLKKTFLGYTNKPKVIAYVLPADAADLSEALAYFATQQVNYIVGPPDCTVDEAQAISDWVIAQRIGKRTYKAVLPNIASDNEGIINFTTDEIQADKKTYTTAGYCGRIAGIIAGTPIKISATFAPLAEVTDIKRLSESNMDKAVDNGELIIFHDGEKVKVGRAVNSLTSITADKDNAFKKIKIVSTVDMMKDDIRLLTQDNYFGKYPNSYDNKCLLITAVQDYFEELENEGVIASGTIVEINVEKTKAYLKENGVDTSKMNDQQIKAANTGSHVFLKGVVSIYDTIEDLDLDMVMA